MRLPFEFNDSSITSDARIKFSYTAPELNQNIEISIDGDEVSIDVLLETYERFLGALGVCIPSNVMLGFIEMNEEEQADDEEETKIEFALEDEEDEDEDEKPPGGKGRKKK